MKLANTYVRIELIVNRVLTLNLGKAQGHILMTVFKKLSNLEPLSDVFCRPESVDQPIVDVGSTGGCDGRRVVDVDVDVDVGAASVVVVSDASRVFQNVFSNDPILKVIFVAGGPFYRILVS